MSAEPPAAPPSPQDVVVAALATPAPEGEGRIGLQADLVVAALIQHGHLPDPAHHDPGEDDYAAAARWLADASWHPRYGGDSGWKRILQSEVDVEVAYTAAERRCTPGEQNALARARAMLLAYTGPHRITR